MRYSECSNNQTGRHVVHCSHVTLLSSPLTFKRTLNQSDAAKSDGNQVSTVPEPQSPEPIRTEEISTSQSPKMDSDDEKLDGIVKIETLESEDITELNTMSDNEEDFHLGNKNGKFHTRVLVQIHKRALTQIFIHFERQNFHF